MENKSLDHGVTEETLQAIGQMESSDYDFPNKFAKKDYIIALVVATICFALILLGVLL